MEVGVSGRHLKKFIQFSFQTVFCFSSISFNRASASCEGSTGWPMFKRSEIITGLGLPPPWDKHSFLKSAPMSESKGSALKSFCHMLEATDLANK